MSELDHFVNHDYAQVVVDWHRLEDDRMEWRTMRCSCGNVDHQARDAQGAAEEQAEL